MAIIWVEIVNFSLDFKSKIFCFIVMPFYSQNFEWEKINHLPNCSGDKKWFCILYITSSTTKVFFSGPFVKVGTNWVLCTPFQNSSFGTNQKAWEKLWQKLLSESRKPTFVLSVVYLCVASYEAHLLTLRWGQG